VKHNTSISEILKPQSNGPLYSNSLRWLVHWPLMGGLYQM